MKSARHKMCVTKKKNDYITEIQTSTPANKHLISRAIIKEKEN
jgi:hypothetical protein